MVDCKLLFLSFGSAVLTETVIKAVASEWDISVSFLDPDKGKSVSAYAIFLFCI